MDKGGLLEVKEVKERDEPRATPSVAQKLGSGGYLLLSREYRGSSRETGEGSSSMSRCMP